MMQIRAIFGLKKALSRTITYIRNGCMHFWDKVIKRACRLQWKRKKTLTKTQRSSLWRRMMGHLESTGEEWKENTKIQRRCLFIETWLFAGHWLTVCRTLTDCLQDISEHYCVLFWPKECLEIINKGFVQWKICPIIQLLNTNSIIVFTVSGFSSLVQVFLGILWVLWHNPWALQGQIWLDYNLNCLKSIINCVAKTQHTQTMSLFKSSILIAW